MVTLQKSLHLGKQTNCIFAFELAPTQAFLSQGAVETLDVGLLVFLVRPGNTMLATVTPHLKSELGLELAAAISLHHLHKTVEASPHAAMQKRCAMLCGECRTQENIGFTAVDVYGGEGKQATKINRIHLHDLAGSGGHRHRAALVVFVPLGAQHILSASTS